ncbi:MAG TPA: type II secretion system F family protein [Opitutales bacterium]|nr:type II secretion system F family protein [Opitutales bacterium]
MPSFSYKAINASGKSVTGTVEAVDRKAAMRQLAGSSLRPVSIESAQDVAAAAQEAFEGSHDFFGQKKAENTAGTPKKRLFAMRTSNSVIALNFLQNLLMLLQSGMTLGDSLRLLQSRVGDPLQKELAGALWKRISEGRTLSSSMAEFPKYFKESHCQLVAAGEASGRLAAVMERIVGYMQESAEIRKKLTASLAYPLFIVGFALIIVVFFLTFLLPRVRTMIETMGGQMQIFAVILVIAAKILVYAGPFILVGGIIAIAAILNWRKTDAGRRATDEWLLQAPIFSDLYQHSHILQTTSLLSTLLDSGINTPEALRLVEKTVQNTILRAGYSTIRRMIQEGSSLSGAFRKTRIMPDLDIDILTVGENTGNISSSLRRIYDIHRSDMSRKMNTVMMVLTTGALFAAFAIVAMIAMSIVMSVLDMSHSMMLRH